MIVCNSSPLIALQQIGQLHLLPQLFISITVPPAVVREVSPSVVLSDWATQHALT
jgi:predicted nucleic acid-binding protein